MSSRLPSEESTSLDLPPDVWGKIAAQLSFVDKARLARVNRAATAGCKHAWSAADYFEMAGDPQKPQRLRVGHRAAAAGDAKEWLALTREMRWARYGMGWWTEPIDLDTIRKMVGSKPCKALMALAMCTSAHEASAWPLYQAALLGAHRPREAARFAALAADYARMLRALATGECDVVTQWLRARLPLPDYRTLASALKSHAHLSRAVVEALMVENRMDVVLRLFAHAPAAAAREIAALDCIRPTEVLIQFYDAAVCAANTDALRALLSSCNPAQQRDVVLRDAPNGAAPGLQCLARILRRWSAGMLDLVLPIWIGAGGDATEALCKLEPMSTPAFDTFVRHGACPHAALRRLTVDRPPNFGEGLALLPRVSLLLAHGARLTAKQFDTFIARHRSLAGGFLTPHGLGHVIRCFERHGAVPQPNGSFTADYRGSCPPGRLPTA